MISGGKSYLDIIVQIKKNNLDFSNGPDKVLSEVGLLSRVYVFGLLSRVWTD